MLIFSTPCDSFSFSPPSLHFLLRITHVLDVLFSDVSHHNWMKDCFPFCSTFPCVWKNLRCFMFMAARLTQNTIFHPRTICCCVRFVFLSIRVKMKFHLSTIADIDFISTRQLVECLLKSQIFVQLTVTASNQRRLAWFHRKISASKAELLQCLHEGRRKTHRTFHYFPRRSQNSENNSEWVRDERAWTTVNWISHLIQWKMCWIIKVNHRRAEEEHNETNWRNRWLACPSPFCLPCCCCFNFISFFIFLSSLPPLSRLRYSSSSFHSPLSPLIAFSASHPWCMHRKLLLGWWEEESCERATKLFFNTSSCI